MPADGLSCDDVRELAPDLALGTLEGDERRAVLTHLDRCGSCRADLAALAADVDLLATLAPPVEPSAGFVGRTTASFTPVLARARERRRPRLALLIVGAVAAVVALVVGTAGVISRTGSTPPPAALAGTPTRVAAMRTPDGRQIGQAVAFGGQAPWISFSMTLPDADAAATYPDGRYEVVLLAKQKGRTPIGEVEVAGRRGAFGIPTDLELTDVQGIEVDAPTGQHLCGAAFT